MNLCTNLLFVHQQGTYMHWLGWWWYTPISWGERELALNEVKKTALSRDKFHRNKNNTQATSGLIKDNRLLTKCWQEPGKGHQNEEKVSENEMEEASALIGNNNKLPHTGNKNFSLNISFKSSGFQIQKSYWNEMRYILSSGRSLESEAPM